MSNTPELLRDAISDLYMLKLTKDAALVSLTYLIMDVASTFDDEVALMWPSDLTFMKIIFFINRYSPFVDSSLSTYLVLVARHTEVCRGLWITLVVALISLAALAVPDPDDGLIAVTGCSIGISDKDGWTLFVVVVIMETTLIALTILRHLQMRAGGPKAGPVMKTMYRDGLFFYAIMLGISIGNLVCMIAAPVAVSALVQLPLRVIHSTLCSRVLFNLRKAALRSSCLSLTLDTGVMFNIMGLDSPCHAGPDPLGLRSFDEPNHDSC